MRPPETRTDNTSSHQTDDSSHSFARSLWDELMNDAAQPWQRAGHGKGSVSDYAIIGAESVAVAVAAPKLALKAFESVGAALNSEAGWKAAEHIPFFEAPKTPPSAAMVEAFDKAKLGVGRLTVTKPVEGEEDAVMQAHAAGFVVDKEGTFLTANHSLEGKLGVGVFINNGVHHEVRLLAIDQQRDLALLRLERATPDEVFHPIPISQSKPERGTPTLAFGIRDGLKVSAGNFLGTQQNVHDYYFGMRTAGGFSGGPIIDNSAKAVGISLQSADRLEGLPGGRLVKRLFGRIPGSEYVTRRFGGSPETYGQGSEALNQFVDANKNKMGFYLPQIDERLQK